MDKIKTIKPIYILLLIITTIILLIYSLGFRKPNQIIMYFSFLYSAISLVIVLCNIKRFYLYMKNNFLNTKIYNNTKKILYKNRNIKKYFEDIKFRNLINLCLSSIINFSFIFIKFIDGLNNKSIWFISLSIYYFLLTVTRVFLFNNLRKNNREKEYIVYKRVGYFIMIINLALVIMIIQMVSSNVSIVQERYIMYLTALYTFYLIISATIDVVKYRKYNSPILSSIKVINLLTASVSILMLQTTMIATFGNNDFEYMKLMNTITGSIISVITLGISIYIIIHGQKRLNNKNNML